jgi:hypothetical protein
MAISIASLRRGKHISPPRLMVYGPHGLGKSSLGAHAPKSVFIQTEDGLGTIDTASFPLCKSFNDVMDCLASLTNEEHDFQTVVLDSADWLEQFVWAEACRIHGKADIEDFGYGKGYTAAVDVWRTVLDKFQVLRDKGMQVIFTAHCTIKRFDSPETEPYDRYQPKLHDKASALIQEWMDGVFFLNLKTIVANTDVGFNQKASRGITTGQRILYTQERPAYLAKNRYNLPAEIVLPENGNNYSAFATALGASMAQPAQVAA